MTLCHHKQTVVPPMSLMTGYEMKTTFWTDFNIADRFGLDAIKDTYNRAFNEWKDDKVYATELVLVLNWKSWEHSGVRDGIPVADKIGSWYADKYYETRDKLIDYWSLEGAERKTRKDWIDYLLKTID